MQNSNARSAVIASSYFLAADAEHLAVAARAQCFYWAHEPAIQLFGIQTNECPPDRIVRRNTVGELETPRQPRLFMPGIDLDLFPSLAATQRCTDTDRNDVQQ